MYLFDFHIHSNHSSDGKNSMADLCTKAIEQGLKEVAISDHFDPSFGNENCAEYKPGEYFRDIKKAKLMFSNKLKIKTAVELGQPHLFPEYARRLIETNSYDYVLASVHRMSNNRDFGKIYYNYENIASYCIRYMIELLSMVKWNKFDCVGHIDMVKKYASRYNVKTSFLDYEDRLEEILRLIIETGKGIEVNSSGLRQSCKECMPNLDILSMYKRLGGEIITVGSDAHTSEEVGAGLKDAIELIKHAGFKYLTVFTERKPEMVKITEKSSEISAGRKLA